MNRAEHRRLWEGLVDDNGPGIVGCPAWGTREAFQAGTLKHAIHLMGHLDPFLARTGGKPSVLVDYGCGYGRWIPFLRPRCEAYVGVEITRQLLSLARTRYEGLDGIRLCSVNEADGSPFLKADLVVSITVLQHNDDEMFADAISVIKGMRPRRLFMHEQTEPEKSTQGAWGRTLDEFRAAFPEHDLEEAEREVGLDGRFHSVMLGVRREP